MACGREETGDSAPARAGPTSAPAGQLLTHVLEDVPLLAGSASLSTRGTLSMVHSLS